MNTLLKMELIEKIDKIDKIFCEYNREHLYDPLVFIGNFTGLEGEAYDGLFWDLGIEDFNCKLFSTNLRKISNHLRNIFVLINMIEELNCKNKKDLPSDWRYRIGLHIKYFHVELRSLMDFIPLIIAETTTKKGQVPCESFNSLITYYKNPKKRNHAEKLLTKNIVDSISKISDCFLFVRYIRDFIVHWAGEDLVFGHDTSEGIIFNLSKFGCQQTLINQDFIKQYYSIIKYNENNVFYFEHYATILLLYLFEFLEDFSEFYMKKYNLENTGDCRSGFGGGMNVYKNWLIKLKSKLEEVKA